MNFIALRQDLASGVGIVRALTHGVSQADAVLKPHAQSWSILEVVCHLYDEEREDFPPPIGRDAAPSRRNLDAHPPRRLGGGAQLQYPRIIRDAGCLRSGTRPLPALAGWVETPQLGAGIPCTVGQHEGR